MPGANQLDSTKEGDESSGGTPESEGPGDDLSNFDEELFHQSYDRDDSATSSM